MDVQLQELIDKIKRDGVATAETEAQNIVSEAEKKAASIIRDAEEKADSIIKNAKAETERMEKASEDAITQAGRNLIISFRDGINRELSALVSSGTESALDKDVLKKLVPETVKAWAANADAADLTVLLSAKDLKALESSLKTALRTHISKGLEIKADASLASGFRIGAKDGSAFYDFSAEEVANLFSAYLNPKTTELMKRAAAGLVDEAPAADKSSEEKESEPAVKKTTRRGTRKTAGADAETKETK
ncbi:MAG: V-type ATP synthase subunit E [Treponema sp.]|jgi:V/A-type H+-transporting ATPase subunit E|nr:V-type ATP synthase subunit E [Treponema sp.]